MEITSQTTLDALVKAFEDTFEGIAFAQIFTKEKLNEPGKGEGDEICSYIDLPAPMNARLFVMMKRDHVMECFEAVYTGLDVDDVKEDMLVDFVNELTNTAAGHFASFIAPEKKDMTIGLPVNPSKEEESICLTPSKAGCVYFFQVEDYAFYTSLTPLP